MEYLLSGFQAGSRQRNLPSARVSPSAIKSFLSINSAVLKIHVNF